MLWGSLLILNKHDAHIFTKDQLFILLCLKLNFQNNLHQPVFDWSRSLNFYDKKAIKLQN